MSKSKNSHKSSNGFLMRLLAYILTSFIIPFAIKMVKRKLIQRHRLVCYKCQGKLALIRKGEYYCKNCKIIRIDHN